MKKMKFVTLLSASLLLAACADTTDTTDEEATTDDTEQVEETEETSEDTTEETEDAATDGEEDTEDDAEETEEEAGDDQAAEGSVLRFGYGAPHGDYSFSATFVGMEDDVITHAYIDEFQFMGEGDWTPVPSDEGEFGEYYDDEATLVSKVENNEGYSEMMAENADATMTLVEGYDAISDFAVGKTVDELNEAIEELNNLDDDQEIADVVSGATLVDTASYLEEIVNIAENGMFVEAADSIEGADFNYSLAAPHGDKAFAVVATLTDGDTVLAAVQDEFQFMEGDEWEGVPNSDSDFGDNYEDGRVLVSKLENDEAYSEGMANAGSEVNYADNMHAILDFVQGKTLAEIEEAISELEAQGEEDEVADVVSGATFVDTAGYLHAIVDASQN